MGLKGINSIHSASNFITKEIDNFLIKEEHFGIPNKSTKPQYAITKSDSRYMKDLGGSDNVKYRCFVTGREIIVESLYTDNGTGSEVFNQGFTDEESFTIAYNSFVEWMRKTI